MGVALARLLLFLSNLMQIFTYVHSIAKGRCIEHLPFAFAIRPKDSSRTLVRITVFGTNSNLNFSKFLRAVILLLRKAF